MLLPFLVLPQPRALWNSCSPFHCLTYPFPLPIPFPFPFAIIVERSLCSSWCPNPIVAERGSPISCGKSQHQMPWQGKRERETVRRRRGKGSKPIVLNQMKRNFYSIYEATWRRRQAVRLTPISMPMSIAIPMERLACQSTDSSNTHTGCMCVCVARVAALTFDSDVKLGVNVERENGPVCLEYIIFLLMTCIFMSSEEERDRGREREWAWEGDSGCKQADFNNKQT